MTSQIKIVPAEANHAADLGRKMRREDALEAEKLGYIPHRILFRSYRSSLLCRTGLLNDSVAAMWGVCGNPLGYVGCPWFVTSEEIRHLISPLDFAILYRREAREMAKMFSLLENWVDSTYTDSIRLMRLIGFNVDNPMPHGKNGAMFRRFWLKS